MKVLVFKLLDRIKIGIVLLVIMGEALFLSGCASKKNLVIEDVLQISENTYTCTFDGVKHEYIVYLPEIAEGAPLVVMLHGYGNTAESFRNMVHFEEDAVARGYVVVYVTGAADPNDATSSTGWNSGIGQEGNQDVAFLVALAKYMQEEYSLDKEKAFAIGFSNGAFMTHRLAMEAADTYTAVVSVAGMMPESIWETAPERNKVGFFQITGEKDDVVPKNSDGSAKFSQAPAIELVMEYWAKSNGVEETERLEVGKASELTKYTKEGKREQVWVLLVKDGRHSWPDEKISGIDMNALILEFLDTQK